MVYLPKVSLFRFNHMHNYTHVMDRMLNVWAFNYVAAGSVTYSIDGGVKKTFLGPAVFVTQPGHHYFYGPAEAKGWDHTFFSWHGSEAQRWAENGLLPVAQPLTIFPITDPISMRQACDRLLELLRDHPLDDDLVLHGLEYVFLHLHRQPSLPVANHGRLVQVQECIAEVQHNPTEPLQLEALASRCHCTVIHLRRLWKAVTGETPTTTLTRCRMNLAAEMLRRGDRVGQTAFAVGYSDQRYFSRLFSKHFGMSPLRYAESFRFSE